MAHAFGRRLGMRHADRSRSALGALLLALLLGALPTIAVGQSLDGVEASPNPLCEGGTATVTVDGMGPCSLVRICYDWDAVNDVCNGGNDCALNPDNIDCIVDPTFPLVVPGAKTYDTAGTYTLAAVSPDCGGPIFTDLEVVDDCLVAAPTGDGSLFPRPGPGELQAVEDTELELREIRPKITGGPFGGVIQPGNEAPFIIVGERFPLPGENGRAFLVGSWGFAELDVWGDAWNANGTGVALLVPDSITGVPDQQAEIVIQTAEGWQSDPWPVDFVAAREVRTLSQNDVELLDCSTSSNADCCNDFYHADTIQWFCPVDPQASYCGSHMTPWGELWPDNGIDSFRIQLANGWEILTIDFDVDMEPGESMARRISGDPAGESSWTEEIAWSTTPNDDVFYRADVRIIGPRGIPHQ